MAKMVKTTLAITIIISLVLAVASCGGGGGNSPKSLAKQYVDLMAELGKVEPNDPKREGLEKKQTDIETKMGQLSEADLQIFSEELEKLSKAAGVKIY
jgi:hypothetical protein